MARKQGSQATQVAVLEERLDGHEKICGERYGEISASFARVHGRLDYIVYGVVAVLLSIVGFAAQKFLGG